MCTLMRLPCHARMMMMPLPLPLYPHKHNLPLSNGIRVTLSPQPRGLPAVNTICEIIIYIFWKVTMCIKLLIKCVDRKKRWIYWNSLAFLLSLNYIFMDNLYWFIQLFIDFVFKISFYMFLRDFCKLLVIFRFCYDSSDKWNGRMWCTVGCVVMYIQLCRFYTPNKT